MVRESEWLPALVWSGANDPTNRSISRDPRQEIEMEKRYLELLETIRSSKEFFAKGKGGEEGHNRSRLDRNVHDVINLSPKVSRYVSRISYTCVSMHPYTFEASLIAPSFRKNPSRSSLTNLLMRS